MRGKDVGRGAAKSPLTGERTMSKRIALTLAAVAALGMGAQAALAGDGHHHDYGRPGGDRFHDNLEHRAFHRELEHREAHRRPMSGGQHARLHDRLEHQAFHDQLRDRAYHRRHDSRGAARYRGWPYSYWGRSAYPAYSSGGIGITGRNGTSFWLSF
jgi:hypothetical protein